MEPIDLNKVYDKIISESNKEPEKPKVVAANYQTRIIRAVFNDKYLNQILDALQPDLLNSDEDTDEKKSLKAGREVIIIEHLLEISDSVGLGLMIEGNSTFLFNTRFWVNIDQKLFRTFLSQVAIKCGIHVLEAKKVSTTDALFAQFEFAGTICKKQSNDNTIKINLLNGTLYIKDSEVGELNELKSHNKEDFFKYQLSFPLDSDAKAPLFMKYLDRVLPDKKSQDILFEYLGYIFTKNMKLERVLILYGTGSNGKSVLFEIITALLGKENISHFSMENICNENGYYRAQLGSKLVNYASEFGGKIDFQIFKKLVSGEPVEARLPYKEPIVIEDYCKFIFNANTLPDTEHTDAFFRRPLILSFSEKISAEERDINLHKKIIGNELSGILNLILDGLQRLTSQQDFSKSEVVDNEHMKFRRESNSVAMFLDDDNWIPSQKETKLKDLYDNYKNYCIETGHRACARPKFTKRLRELGYEIKLKGTNNYTYVFTERINQKGEENPFAGFLDEILNN